MLGLLFVKLYEARKVEEPDIAPSQIFSDLLETDTVESVSGSLKQPTYGDLGEFTGYDWPESKQSGVGGSTQLSNPTKLSMLRLGKYVPFANPSIDDLVK